MNKAEALALVAYSVVLGARSVEWSNGDWFSDPDNPDPLQAGKPVDQELVAAVLMATKLFGVTLAEAREAVRHQFRVQGRDGLYNP